MILITPATHQSSAQKKSILRQIIRHEWLFLYRRRVVVVGLVLLILASIVSMFFSVQQYQRYEKQRIELQNMVDSTFDTQPNRHPHRMVHFGQFVFKPLDVLASFDIGITDYTGQLVYLEGHRQNTANFGDVRQSSILVRFGQFTPAMVWQILAPLLLILVGFSLMARERESGMLCILRTLSVKPSTLIFGKLITLLGIVGIILTPLLLGLGYCVIFFEAPLLTALMIFLSYTVYLVFWAVCIIIISASCVHTKTALVSLLSFWLFMVIVLPRVASTLSTITHPLPDKTTTDFVIARQLDAMGDSHNPDDPYFNDFKASVLKQYQVSRIEDLPFNYKGLLAIEGEKQMSLIFNQSIEAQSLMLLRQNQLADLLQLYNPALSIRKLSMILAGTELEMHDHFLKQAEDYRYNLIQALNQLQLSTLTYADDRNRNKDAEAARRVRLDPTYWKKMPDFTFQPLPKKAQYQLAAPYLLSSAIWLMVLVFGLIWTARRLNRDQS